MLKHTELRTLFDRDGFVVIRDFLSARLFAELRTELDRYVREVVPTLPDVDAFYDDRARPETLKQMVRIEQDPYFAAMLTHPAWTATAEALLGEPVTAQGAEWFNKPAGTNHVTPPHQDNFYFCMTPPSVLTMWLALDSVDEENGCLRYIPGSHQRGIRQHRKTKTLGFSQGIADFGDADFAAEMPIHAQPNDVLIHHGSTIHRANANTSPVRHRRSFALVFYGASARRDEPAFARYLESSKSQQVALGLNV
ncbi:MAG: phytanoyl-CoA dioxygenase family protein [Planctomycetaceae bacterium]|nr:phytanoyl-CoA dioxygenase family protein [Planctomycetaceae bacterium]